MCHNFFRCVLFVCRNCSSGQTLLGGASISGGGMCIWLGALPAAAFKSNVSMKRLDWWWIHTQEFSLEINNRLNGPRFWGG